MAVNLYNKIVLGNDTVMDVSDASLKADSSGESSKILDGETAYGNDGKIITGTCTYDADTSDANAVEGEILNTRTAYVNGSKVTGNMPNNAGTDIVLGPIADGETIEASISEGYYDGTGKVLINDTDMAKLIPANIAAGVKILGVVGSYEGDEIKVTPDPVEAYTTDQTYNPASYYPSSYDPSAHGGDMPTAYASFTVKAIATETVANSTGTTLKIGKVK